MCLWAKVAHLILRGQLTCGRKALIPAIKHGNLVTLDLLNRGVGPAHKIRHKIEIIFDNRDRFSAQGLRIAQNAQMAHKTAARTN